ncbi:MAG: hypothetical protein ACMX3H_15285 [Sodalis sp. (in: enterobacteria)]|uniref:YhdP family protein n=1 Tax=Sodalis sp. (in: enterobacteria) TaxID=1898979 RepID=UPI0039E70902
MNSFRPQIVSVLNRAFDADIQLWQLHGSWQSFGPTLDIGGIDAATADERLHVQRATLALDVWQSLLHWRWQFRDVTFYRLQLDLNTTLMGRDHQGSPISFDRLSNLFLRQFDHFILRGSQITFLTPSGERTRLSVPQLTWLNTSNRHRAEGKISLSNTDVQQGAIDVRMDLHDQQGLLDNGKVYLKAQDIDLKPWFSQLLQSNTGLQSADFSLAAWLTLENGEIAGADALLSRGAALWQDGDQAHRLDVNQLALHLSKRQDAWQMDVPALTIATDGQSWAPVALSLFWLPAKRHLFFPDREGEIRLRARGLALERFTPLLPFISAVTPTLRALARPAAARRAFRAGAGHPAQRRRRHAFSGALARSRLAALGVAAGGGPCFWRGGRLAGRGAAAARAGRQHATLSEHVPRAAGPIPRPRNL